MPVGQRVEDGVVAAVTGTEPATPWVGATQAAAPLGNCNAASVTISRRYESPADIIVEAVAGFETPRERGAFVVWVTIDSAGLAQSLFAVGDGVWAMRCLGRCHKAQGCPEPRLTEPVVHVGQAEIVSSDGTRRKQLEVAYGRWLALTPGKGGYERWVASNVVLDDMTSGRQRLGVDGFVEALEAVSREYPRPHRVENLRLMAFGDSLVARFFWVATDRKGRPVRRAMTEIVSFDADSRVVMSRGYGMPVPVK